jgi:excisionase family DNA binding protein
LETKVYCTSKDLQDRLKVDRSTIYRWRKEGMPSEKWGYAVRFDYEAVLEWLKNKK